MDSKIKVDDLVEVSRPNNPGYKPWIGRVYYRPFNQGLAVESFEKASVGMGSARCSREIDCQDRGTVWEKIIIPDTYPDNS